MGEQVFSATLKPSEIFERRVSIEATREGLECFVAHGEPPEMSRVLVKTIPWSRLDTIRQKVASEGE